MVTDGGSESSTSTSTAGDEESTAGAASSSDGSSGAASGESSEGATETAADETGAPPPPGEILFAADFDDALFPVYGFTYEATTPDHSVISAVPNAGPNGEDLGAIDVLTAPPYQPYIGWSKQSLPMTPMGESRYIRLLFRIHSPCDGVGTTDVWDDKFIILGDGVADPWGGLARVIVMLGDPLENSMRTTISRNIDGAEHGTEGVRLECGEWHWLQWEVRSSSSPESEDGGFRFWVDDANASYDDATAVSPGFPLLSFIEEEQGNAWNNINLGYFVGTSLASGSIGFDFAAFEYGTAFDPGWHG